MESAKDWTTREVRDPKLCDTGLAMNPMKAVLFFWLSVALTACATSGQYGAGSPPVVILVSIDGYRYDYTEKYRPPYLTGILPQVAHAEGLKPIYPSKTFPNHYAIVTGLTADHHGIVANEFYDPTTQSTYSMKNASAVADGRWYGGFPLWNLAEKNGVRSACYFWPGSEAEIGGLRPSVAVPYDMKTPNSARVNQVLKWLQLPTSQRPRFITLYFSVVDTAGHKDGPDAPSVKEAVLEVDQMLAHLQEGLGRLGVAANVIVVSDHGMQPIDPNQLEFVDDFADLEDFVVMGDGTHALLYLKEGRDKKLIETTLRKLKKGRHLFKAYARQETPLAWNYRNNPRIGDIVLEGVAPKAMQLRKHPFKVPKGNHGYDPGKNKNMLGIFYAWGPDIQSGVKLPVIENTEIYPLVVDVLGLTGGPTIDGKGVLRSLRKVSP